MWEVENQFIVKIGSNTYINVPEIIVYNDEPLFEIVRAENTRLLGVNFDIYDENGSKVATIRRGMIVQGDKNNYIIRKDFDHFTVKEKSSERMICEIKKRDKAGDAELELNVHMYTKDGFLLKATPLGTNVKNLLMRNCTFKNCRRGLIIPKQNGTMGIGIG